MGFKFPILIAGFCLVTGAVNAEELNAYSIMPEKPVCVSSDRLRRPRSTGPGRHGSLYSAATLSCLTLYH